MMLNNCEGRVVLGHIIEGRGGEG